MGSVGSYFYTPAKLEIVEPMAVATSNIPCEIIESTIEQQDIILENELINHFKSHECIQDVMETLDDYAIECKKKQKKRWRDRRRRSLK